MRIFRLVAALASFSILGCFDPARSDLPLEPPTCQVDPALVATNDSLVMSAVNDAEGGSIDPPFTSVHDRLRQSMLSGQLTPDYWTLGLQLARFLNGTDSAVIWIQAAVDRDPQCPQLQWALARALANAEVARAMAK